MKVRIGIGAAVSSQRDLDEVASAITRSGFDSLWCSEVLTSRGLDPMIALTWAAAQHPTLKLGTTMLLPGRNIVRLARQLAGLDGLSAGRLLVTFVPGINRGPEAEAIGLPLARRRAAIEEALPVLRELLGGAEVSHHGEVASFTDVAISPLPVQQPLEFWLGGMAPRSLRLCGQLADGWLPSLCTPAEAAAGRLVVEDAATEAGRAIDPEHFGVSIAYSRTALRPAAHERLVARYAGRDPGPLVPVGLPAVRTLLEEFIGVGFSKFVLRPLEPPASWEDELDALAGSTLPLQT